MSTEKESEVFDEQQNQDKEQHTRRHHRVGD